MHPFCEIHCHTMYTCTEHRLGIHSSVLKLVECFYKCRLMLADESHRLHNVDQGYTRTPVYFYHVIIKAKYIITNVGKTHVAGLTLFTYNCAIIYSM